MNDGHIFIDDEITPATLNYVKQRIAESVNAPKLTVHIQSPGGSVYAGYNIYHALKATGKPIECIVEGEAQSMATFIALAASPGQLKICNPSIWMIHMPSSGIQGTADDHESGASELRNIENDMVMAYAAKTGLPDAQIREMMRKTTTLNATQAGQMKFVDQVLGSYLTAAAMGRTKNKMKKDNIILNTVNSVLTTIARALGEPTALDIPLQDGTVLTSSATGEDTIMGSTVTLNGTAAPDGDYNTIDGMTITVTGGVVTNVVDPTDAAKPAPYKPMPPAPTQQPVPAVPIQAVITPPITASADEITALKTKLAEMEAAKAEAETKLNTQTTALGEIKKEVAKMKAQPVGDQDEPSMGITPLKHPAGMSGVHDARMHNVKMSKQFILQNLGWLERYYPAGHFDDVKNGPSMTSIIETNFNFTYPGILTTDLFYKPTLSSPALSDLFTIDQGISFQKRYNLIPGLSKVIKPYTGCGAANSNGSRDLIGNTTLTTKEFRMQESWCKDDFTQQLTGIYNNLAQEWLKTGERSFDPAGTPIDGVIQEVLTDAMRRDLFIRATMAAGNSSSADFNQIDGLWDRLIDSSGASNYCVVKASGTTLGNATPTAANATAALEAVYIQSNDLLKEQMDKATYWVTGSVYDAYVNQLIGTGNVSQAQYEALIKGTGGNTTWGGNLTYKGIPIKPVRLWDNSLADSNNPLFGTTKNLILLTVKPNHMLGVESSADLNKIESWYEMKDSKRYYRSDFKIGYQYLHCDLQTIAY